MSGELIPSFQQLSIIAQNHQEENLGEGNGEVVAEVGKLDVGAVK